MKAYRKAAFVVKHKKPLGGVRRVKRENDLSDRFSCGRATAVMNGDKY